MGIRVGRDSLIWQYKIMRVTGLVGVGCSGIAIFNLTGAEYEYHVTSLFHFALGVIE